MLLPEHMCCSSPCQRAGHEGWEEGLMPCDITWCSMCTLLPTDFRSSCPIRGISRCEPHLTERCNGEHTVACAAEINCKSNETRLVSCRTAKPSCPDPVASLPSARTTQALPFPIKIVQAAASLLRCRGTHSVGAREDCQYPTEARPGLQGAQWQVTVAAPACSSAAATLGGRGGTGCIEVDTS